jgi:predicted nucleotidyltransferase
MTSLLEQHQEAILALCREYSVTRLEVFGSAARDDFDPQRSDLDFLVTFAPLPPGEKADAYFGFLAALEDLFGRPIDLVEPGAVKNPYVRRTIDRHRQTLYAAA